MTTNKTLSFVFPGQGSQQVGMLSAYAQDSALFPLIQKTFDTASQVLGKDLWALSQQGPIEELNKTVNTQPLLLTAGVALWRVWQAKNGSIPHLLAGHSLGEYTALVCAQSISLEDGVQLVAHRAQFMQDAVPMGQGAMAAVLGLDDALLQAACDEAAEGEVVSCVNFNSIGQTVIAGTKTAVERAAVIAKTKGAKKVVMLPVSVPSHCALMKDAAKALSEKLAHIRITAPHIPIIHNVDVDMSSHPDDIRQKLVDQLCQPVRWVETIQRFASEGIQTTVECGPGKVLSALIKRIDPALSSLGIENPSDLDNALNTLR